MKKTYTQKNRSRDIKYINWKMMYQGKLKMKGIHNKKLKNAYVAIEGEHADLPHNIIPPEENAI